MSRLYDILGIKNNATDKEIKKAHRDKAKKNHPDKQGGSKEAMQEINKAYEILKDPVRRNRYDETGNTEKEDKAAKMRDYLVNLLEVVILEDSVKYRDPLEDMKIIVAKSKLQLGKEILKIHKSIKITKEIKERMERKSGRNLFTIGLDAKLTSQEQAIKIKELDIEFYNEVWVELKHYEYRVDKGENLSVKDTFNYL